MVTQRERGRDRGCWNAKGLGGGGRQPGVRYAINSNTRRTAQDISTSTRLFIKGEQKENKMKMKENFSFSFLLFDDLRGLLQRERSCSWGGSIAYLRM